LCATFSQRRYFANSLTDDSALLSESRVRLDGRRSLHLAVTMDRYGHPSRSTTHAIRRPVDVPGTQDCADAVATRAKVVSRANRSRHTAVIPFHVRMN